mmetsp:Transcript_4028/g.10092  ORF Transcript_4028/g.10092 Transcript_4028/m.10092 type:complete len:242 (-) Transcript_4028:206-931(-)
MSLLYLGPACALRMSNATPQRMSACEAHHPGSCASGGDSLRASRPTTMPETMVASAACVHTTTARPAFMPRFWQKMPSEERQQEHAMPRGASSVSCSSSASSMPTRADAADRPKSIPACRPAMSSIRLRGLVWSRARSISVHETARPAITSPSPSRTAISCSRGTCMLFLRGGSDASRSSVRRSRASSAEKAAPNSSSSATAGTSCGIASGPGVAVAPMPTVPSSATTTPHRSVCCSSSFR